MSWFTGNSLEAVNINMHYFFVLLQQENKLREQRVKTIVHDEFTVKS